MKVRPIIYADEQNAPTAEPRYVMRIEFGASDFEYFASHTGITDIPAGTYQDTLADWSAVSQLVDPSTGASRIGSLTVQIADVAEVLTDEIQARLAAGDGLRDKLVVLYKGFHSLSFNDFEIKYTQQIRSVSENRGIYSIKCADLQRSMRSQLFEKKTTNLDATLAAGASSMTVADTSAFIMVAHGTSYSHGPSATWGYIQIDDEIIGYTGKTATTFTGLARGLFNTDDDDHTVDGGDPPERRPAVTEYVYLEMPVPKLVKALMTGVLHGQGANLPAHWHLGIDAALLNDAQFTGIGEDLWDPSNDAVGLIARFTDIAAIDGKRFIESECFLLAQIFSPVLSDGRLGLKRLTPALAGAAHVATLDDKNVVKHGELSHQMTKTVNRTVINWSWVSGEFKRSTIKIDAASIALHGEAPIKTYNFRGLAANSATDSVLTQRFDAIRDRFSSPPMSISVQVFKYLDALEVGDIVRLALPNVRDMTAATVNPIDRSFEVRQISESRKSPVRLMLVGSSATPTIVAPSSNALPDAYYDQAGTELSTVVPITAGVTDSGSPSLTGNASMASAIYYYIGNLTIAADTTINIDKNVQLRIRGHLTVNGKFDGEGDGHAGIADVVGIGSGPGGTVGYFGNTHAGNGIKSLLLPLAPAFRTRLPDTIETIGKVSALPVFNLVVNGNALEGVPDDLQGTSGGPGGKLIDETTLEAVGGTGGAGGAGLMIVCRGISFGAAGLIDLDGADGSAGVAGTLTGYDVFSGGGGGGAPGALFIALDGNVTSPVLTNKFSAVGGTTIISGNPLDRPFVRVPLISGDPYTGYFRDAISNVDYFDGAHRVQYVPIDETAVEDLPDASPRGAVTGIAEPDITLHWTQAADGGAWDPTDTTADLDIKFRQAGSDVARDARRVTRAADGTLTVSDQVHKDGSDLNTSRLTITPIFGSANRTVTIKTDYSFGGDNATVSETFSTVQGGDDGGDGDDAVTGIAEPDITLHWTQAADGGAWDPTNTTADLDIKFRQAGSDVARDARRVTRAADGTLTVSDQVHKDGSDLNTSRLTITPIFGSANRAVTIKTDYSFGGDNATVSETFSTVQGGDDGAVGGDGADAITSHLTNEAHVAPADKDGNAVNLSGSGGTHQVFDDTTDVTSSATHSIVGGSGSPSEKTQNGLKISVVVATGVYTISETSTDSWSTDLEQFTLRAVYGGKTIDKNYSIAKAKAGGNEHTVTVTGQAISDEDQTIARAGVRVNNDGTLDKREGTVFSQIAISTDWIKPNDHAGKTFHVKCTRTSGSETILGAGTGSWINTNTNSQFYIEENGSSIAQSTILIEISGDGGITVTESGSFPLTADHNPE